jgi:hypothetical protein
MKQTVAVGVIKEVTKSSGDQKKTKAAEKAAAKDKAAPKADAGKKK